MKPYSLAFLLFSFITIGITNSSYTQCDIGEIEATPTECDSSGYFDMIINFEYANTGSQGFTLQGSGMMYGTFEYSDLPVILYDLYGDGTTYYEFVVIDVEFPDCSNFIDFGTVDCFGGDCAIWNVDVFPQECDSGYFDVTLGFWHENVGSMGFRVQGNGTNYGNFEYADLPISIGPLEGDGVTEYEFVVTDNEFGNCTDWASIDPVNCQGGGDCEIGELVIDEHPCDSNGMYYVYFDFDYANVSDSGFALYINYDLYGYYSYYDLPLENLGPFLGDGSAIYHFLVRDAVTEECASDANFGPIDCGSGGDCNIWNLVLDDHPCDSTGMFYLYLDFEYENVSDTGFMLSINNDFYGIYNYADLPLLDVGPLAGDGTTIYHFLVQDLANLDCLEDADLGPIDCGIPGDCEIGELDVTILPCNDIDEYYVLLDFNYASTSDGFSVQGGGMMYGSYLYADLPVEVGPFSGNGNSIYQLAVVDDVFSGCLEDTQFGPVSCDSITAFMNFSTQVVSCEGDAYTLDMNFDVINGGNNGFTILGNGENYGSYEYSQLPVSIGPLTTDGTTYYHFIAKDNEQPAFGNWNKLTPFTCQSLGITEIDQYEIVKVYPNPTSGSVVFDNLYGQSVSVYLYNSTGAQTSNFNMSDSYQINDLNAGMYFYRIVSEGKVIISGKLVVTK